MKPVSNDAWDSRLLAAQIYDNLLDAILDEEIAPNTHLIQSVVAERLGVSRTPVRDTLNRLALEGVVTRVPGGGYLVNDLTDQLVEHVSQVRQELEALAVRHAFGKYSSLDLTRLEALINEMAAEEVTNSARHFELNRKFHAALVEPCGNPILKTTLDKLWDHPTSRRLTKAFVRDEVALNRMVTEHRGILDAARGVDVELLVASVRHHVVLGNDGTPVTN